MENKPVLKIDASQTKRAIALQILCTIIIHKPISCPEGPLQISPGKPEKYKFFASLGKIFAVFLLKSDYDIPKKKSVHDISIMTHGVS